MRNILTVALLALCGLGVSKADDERFFIFKPIPAKSYGELTDWKSLGAPDDLAGALTGYESDPSMNTAVGVLKHYNVLAKNKELRFALLGAGTKVFQTLDAARYELIMQTQINLSERFADQGGIAFSIRVGSTGERHRKWVDWSNEGGDLNRMPELNPNKQFSSDDDITNVPNPRANEANPVLGELLNGQTAREEFIKTAKRYHPDGLDPKDMQVEFLSPTKAYPVLRLHQPGEFTGKWPDYLFEWVRSNPEKYNGLFAVEQLHYWAETKGWVTQDIKNPLGTTTTYSEFKGKPASEEFEFKGFPEGDLFGWVANNHRQVFVVHEGELKSLAKYIERLIITYEELGLAASAQMDGTDIKTLASTIANPPDAHYKPPAGAKEQLHRYIRNLIREAHRKSIANLAFHLTEAINARSRRPNSEEVLNFEPFKLQELLETNPELFISLNALSCAYTNVDADLISDLRKDLADSIARAESDPGVSPQDYYMAHLSLSILSAAGEALRSAEFSRAQAEANQYLREQFSLKVNDHLVRLSKLNLDHYLLKVATGDFSQKELRFVADNTLLVVDRQLTPEDIARDMKAMETFYGLFQWGDEALARHVKEYFEGKPGDAVRILQLLHEIADPSKVRPMHVRYTDEQGKIVRKVIQPTRLQSGLSLGLVAFKTAIKGGAKIWKVWGDFQDGYQLFENLHKIYLAGGLDRAELARAQAQALASHISMLDYLKAGRITHDIPIGNTLAAAASLSGESFTSDSVAQELAFAFMKDLSLLYAPNLTYAYFLWGVSNWAWGKYSLAGSRSDILDLLVENGIWEADQAGVELPQIRGFRYYDGQRPPVVEPDIRKLAKLLPAEHELGIVLMKSKRTVHPREALMDIAYREGKIESDFLLDISLKAIQDLFSLSFLKMPLLTTSSRNWTSAWLKGSYGITVPTPEDAVFLVRGKIDLQETDRGWAGYLGERRWTEAVSDGTRKTFGYLVSDFWVKRQILLEGPILEAVVAEAARRLFRQAVVSREETTFLAELDKLDERLMDVDRRVWPQIARSADPFEGEDYDQEKDIPITEAFRRMTALERSTLKRFVDWLEDPDRDDKPMYEMAPVADEPMAVSDTTQPLSFEDVKAEARKVMDEITRIMFEVEANYDQVLEILTNSGAFVDRSGGFSPEPYHARLRPGSGILNDISNARQWANGYKDEYVQVTEDVAAVLNQIGVKPESVNPVFDATEQAIETWTGEGPAQFLAEYHPYWNRLVRLRFQIHTLQNSLINVVEVTRSELTAAVSEMLLKDQPVSVPDIRGPVEIEQFIKDLIRKMEEEYLELLQLAMEMFKMSLAVQPDDPVLTDLLSARVTIAPKNEGVDEATMKNLVKSYRWELLKGSELSGVAPFIDVNTGKDQPEWEHVLNASGPFMLRVSALGERNLPLAKITKDLTVRPAQLSGELQITGDPEGNTVKLFLTQQGVSSPWEKCAVSQAGPFDCMIEHLDPVQLKRTTVPSGSFIPFESYAAVREEGSIVLESDRVPVTLTKGLFKLDSPLMLHFPSAVNIAVKVTDVSGEEVQAKKSVSSENLTDTEPPYVLRLKADDIFWARAQAESLNNIEASSARSKYDPSMGTNVSLNVVLPFFDTGHLEVSGRFAPGAGVFPPARIIGGMVSPNIDNPGRIQDGGSFKFTNNHPVIPGERFTMRALVYGEDDRLFQPEMETIDRDIPEDKAMALGDILLKPLEVKVKPILVRVTDWRGEVLPDDQLKVKIEHLEIPRSGDVYEGLWVFSKRNENAKITAQLTLPDGTSVTGQESFSIDQVLNLFDPKPPEDPITIRLAVYPAGKLLFKGSTQIAVPADIPRPDRVILESSTLSLREDLRPGEPFEIRSTVPVRAGATLTLSGTARADAFTFSGQGNAAAQSESVVVDFGMITLRMDDRRITVPDVAGWQHELAEQAIRDAGLRPVIQPAGPADLSHVENKVKETRPSHPAQARLGERIEVLVYGPYVAPVTLLKVPKVTDMPTPQAVQTLKSAGFLKVDSTAGKPAENESQQDLVYDQTPDPFTEHDPDIPVRIIFFGKFVPAVVPPVLNMDYRRAKGVLEDEEYSVALIPGTPFREKAGVVYDQQPPAGTPWEKGRSVSVTYHTEETEAVPDVPPPLGEEAQPFFAALTIHMPEPVNPIPEKIRDEPDDSYRQRVRNFFSGLNLNNVRFKPMPDTPLVFLFREQALETYPRTLFAPGEKFSFQFQMTASTKAGPKSLSGGFLLSAVATYDTYEQVLAQHPKVKEAKGFKTVEVSSRTGECALTSEKVSISNGRLIQGWSRQNQGFALDFYKAIALWISEGLLECFIANAVYGNPYAPQLDVLRRFRDDVLLESPSGRRWVAAYYRFGPAWAAKIRSSPIMLAATRIAMDHIVRWLDGNPMRDPVKRRLIDSVLAYGDRVLIRHLAPQGIDHADTRNLVRFFTRYFFRISPKKECHSERGEEAHQSLRSG